MDYKTPQETFTNAINFDTKVDEESGKTMSGTTRTLQSKFNNLLRRINDSEYIYPTISVLMVTIMVIIVVFNQKINILIKCLAVVLLLLFIIYTIYQYRYK